MAPNRIIEVVERRVLDALEEAGLGRGALLIAAVSGGPDSLAMLYALARLRAPLDLSLHVAHLDHRLRGDESTADARFVEETCRGLGIPVTVEETDVAAHRRSKGLSLEEAARDLRYDFLSTLSEQHGARGIALGHTADDQAETVLMNILRGTGLTGLRGMDSTAERVFNDRRVTVLRPLLGVSREEAAAYCRALGLSPREDRSNRSVDIRRNRVRLELIPLLEEYNPSIKEALRRLSESASRDLDYLDAQVDSLWERVALVSDGYLTLDRRGVSALAPGLQGHLLRRALLSVKGDLKDIGQDHVDAIVRLLGGPSGKALDLPGGVRVSTTYEEAIITSADVDPCPLPPLDGQTSLNVPGVTVMEGWRVTADMVDSHKAVDFDEEPDTSAPSVVLDATSLGLALCVRPWQAGDRFQPLGMSGTKKLQDFFVDARVPHEWRDRVPLLVSSKGIAWVVGWRIAEWARVKDDTSGALEVRFQRSTA